MLLERRHATRKRSSRWKSRGGMLTTDSEVTHEDAEVGLKPFVSWYTQVTRRFMRIPPSSDALYHHHHHATFVVRRHASLFVHHHRPRSAWWRTRRQQTAGNSFQPKNNGGGGRGGYRLAAIKGTIIHAVYRDFTSGHHHHYERRPLPHRHHRWLILSTLDRSSRDSVTSTIEQQTLPSSIRQKRGARRVKHPGGPLDTNKETRDVPTALNKGNERQRHGRGNRA